MWLTIGIVVAAAVVIIVLLSEAPRVDEVVIDKKQCNCDKWDE